MVVPDEVVKVDESMEHNWIGAQIVQRRVVRVHGMTYLDRLTAEDLKLFNSIKTKMSHLKCSENLCYEYPRRGLLMVLTRASS